MQAQFLKFFYKGVFHRYNFLLSARGVMIFNHSSHSLCWTLAIECAVATSLMRLYPFRQSLKMEQKTSLWSYDWLCYWGEEYSFVHQLQFHGR